MTTGARHRNAAHHLAERVTRARRPELLIAVAAVGAVVASVLGSFATASAGPEYTVGAQVVSDEFDRAAGAGWGGSAQGGDYSLAPASAFSTDGAAGLANPPRPGSSVTATLPGAVLADAQASTTFALGAVPQRGNGVYAGIQLRSVDTSYYLASLRVATGGRAFLSILRIVNTTATQVALVRDLPVGADIVAGTQLHLDFRVTGTSPVQLQARAWLDAAPAPEWQAVVDDTADIRIQLPGAVALWTYISGGSEAQPVAYDSLAAWQLDVAAPEPAPSTPTAPSTTPPSTGGEPLPDGIRGTPGAGAVGSAQYAVPEGAVIVDPAGHDTGAGTVTDPLATIAAALARTTASTIVLRAGSYHGSVVIPTNRSVTIQPYPGEAVWLDGARVVENWQPDGDAWVADGWTAQFDASPTYSRGAADGTAAGWQFVSPDYPMAAHPDQVWVDGVAQAQVGSRAEVVPGTFFVDYGAKRLYLGSDPTGSQVRASDTVKALVIAGKGSVIKGIGIRGFSPSVPDIGAVAIAAANVTLENVTITDSATTGLAIFSANATVRQVSILRSGMLGAQASTADGLLMTGLLVADNNTEHFNRAPVSGGVKIHKSRHVTVRDSALVANRGNGLWFDESVYDMTVVGNDILDSVGNGLVIELSATAVVADNTVMRSERDGIFVSDSGSIQIWNNTIAENDRGINIVQDSRRASNLSAPGHDMRQALPDPAVTWVTGNVTVKNNVIAAGRGKCIICVEDYSHERSAAQMGVKSDGNVLQRTSATTPVWAVVWSRGAGDPAVYTTVAAFAKATGQDADSLALDAAPALEGTALTPAVAALESSVAQPLDATVALRVGQSAEARHLGAWPRTG